MVTVGQADADGRTERSVTARDVKPGMEIYVKRGWHPVVGAVPTSAARHSVTWRTDSGDVDFWVGDPSTTFKARW